MTAVLRRELTLQEEERGAAFAAPSDIKRGEITEVDGSIEGDLPYLVWVKPFEPNANPLQMLNPGVIENLQVDMPVFYKQDPEAPALWSLVDFDEGTFASDASTFLTLPGVNIPPHAVKHIMAPGNPGPDPLNVYSHAMVDFSVRPTQPTSMKVRVSSGWYPGADNYEFFTGPANSKDFTSDIPASAGKSLIVAIGVDKTGTLVYNNGVEYVTGEPVPDASWPVVPATRLLISAIRLDNGMTIIQNENFDHEMRPVFAPGGLARANRLWEFDSNSDTIRPVDNEFVRLGLDEQADTNIADHWFEIISEGSNPHIAHVKYNATAATGVLKNVYRAKGTQSSPTAVVDNDIIFNEQFYAYAATGVNWFQVAQMRVEIDGTPSGDDIPGSIVFAVHTPGDPGGNMSERLRLSPTEVLVNGQQEEIDFRFPGSLGEDNVFFISGLDEFVGFGTGTSSTSRQVEFLMKADRDILIDGATNERTIDTGVMRFEQIPAIPNTRGMTFNVDINSQENSHAVVVNVVTTQLQAGESVSAYDINIDAANAGGGVVRGFEMSCVDPSGVLECHAIHADPGVSPVFQLSGSFISVEQGWQDAGGFTDTTVAFNSGATDINVFVSNGDVLYWGMAATFTAIEVDLNTNASGAGIKPTFEFSDGIGGWTTFTPSDESQGFRQSGVISWVVADLSGWAQDTVNGVGSKFWIRITRTAVALTTPPNEETLLVAATTEYEWDEDGLVSISGLGVNTSSPDATIEIIDTTEQLRLTHTDGSKFVSFTLDTNHDLTIKPSSTGQIILQPTANSIDFLQVLDAASAVVFNVDTTNKRVGIGNAAPAALLDITRTFTDATKIIDVSAVAQPSANYVAVDIGPQIEPQANIGTIFGSLNTIDIDNSAFDITTNAIACQYQVRLRAGYSGTVTNGIALNVQPPQVQAGTLTETVGLNIGALVTTTSKGIVSRTASAANRWNLYLQGTADNYLQGDTGIGINAPLGKIHVDQSSTTSAIPVAYFDQADISEEMFEFATTIGVGNAIEAVGAKTLTVTHFIKVTIPGGLTRYFPVGTIA